MTLNPSGYLAHNDWLELLSNFGLVGVSSYIFFFYAAYKSIKTPYWSINNKIIFFTVILIWFLTTLFSMGYTSDGGYVRAMLIAYFIGSYTIKKTNP